MQSKWGRETEKNQLLVHVQELVGASQVISPQSWYSSREITAQKRRAQAKTQPSSGRSDPFPGQPSSDPRAALRNQASAPVLAAKIP